MSNKQILENIKWKKTKLLSDGFICVVDAMGDDSAIVQAARVSYNGDTRDDDKRLREALAKLNPGDSSLTLENCGVQQAFAAGLKVKEDEEVLLRHLMRHAHSSPFEQAEIKFLIRMPFDAHRQQIRHRTANVNEYSTRYTDAIDSMDVTPADGWRLQAKSNRQGSDGKLEVWPDGCPYGDITPGEYLTSQEAVFHEHARNLYQERLELGVAKEQARKDLPLSNYTEYYWKCDVGNILHYLGLRMDSHAQWEIRQYANAMGEFVKLLFPQTWQAFIDYRLEAMTLTRLDREVIKRLSKLAFNVWPQETFDSVTKDIIPNKRERQECWDKYLLLGLVEQK